MAIANRVLPINYAASRDNLAGTIPKTAIQSVTMAVRTGPGQFAVGYIQEFGWTADRDVKMVHQIEPYPNGTFNNQATLGGTDFDQSMYWPGEPVEGIPGKIDGIPITFKRAVLYTSNMLAAFSRLNGAGNYNENVPVTNDAVNDTANVNKYVSIIQQVRPIDIYQMFISPVTGQIVFGRVFEECWFTKITETIPAANANEEIVEDGELKAVRVRPYYTLTGEVSVGANP
jgi:hypothetical protein